MEYEQRTWKGGVLFRIRIPSIGRIGSGVSATAALFFLPPFATIRAALALGGAQAGRHHLAVGM